MQITLAISAPHRDATDLECGRPAGSSNLRRLGKRICIGFEDELWLVIHLMIAGRLHWKAETRKSLSPRSSSKFKAQLALFHFDVGRFL